MVTLLLNHGADPFLSTLVKDCDFYSVNTQKGCFSAISVAASHRQKRILMKLITEPNIFKNKKILSLEEILAEGKYVHIIIKLSIFY